MIEKGVDVEKVMEAVNRAIAAPDTLLAKFWKEEEPVAPNLAFIYPPYSKSLQVNLDLVSRNWEIDSEFEIGSKRRVVGGLIVVFKRFTRRVLRWYINPIAHQVRKFNMLVTRTLFDISNNLEQIQERLSKLESVQEEVLSGGEYRETDKKDDLGEGRK